jgi:hypothetical protein
MLLPFFHVLPLSHSDEVFENRLEPPQGIDLPVPEVFQDSISQQPEQVAPFRVSSVGDFLKINAGGGQKDPIENRECQKEDKKIETEHTEKIG